MPTQNGPQSSAPRCQGHAEHHERVDAATSEQDASTIAERAEVLAEDDLAVLHRHRDEELDRADALLFGERAHRDERDDETQSAARHGVEHALHRGAVDLPEAALVEEEAEPEDHHARRDDDVRERRVEVGAELALRDRPDHLDGARAIDDDLLAQA